MGLMSKYVIEVYALSGVVVRANDFRKDLRLVGYSYYSRIEFNVVVGIKGDSMDRYLVRMNESLESVKLNLPRSLIHGVTVYSKLLRWDTFTNLC